MLNGRNANRRNNGAYLCLGGMIGMVVPIIGQVGEYIKNRDF